MGPKEFFPETPSQPHASVLRDQLDANEQLLLAALRAQEEAEEARSGRIVAQDESDELRATAQLRERMLGIVGHDLRNPLNTMVVAAELLASGKHPEKSAWFASRIIESGRRMARMIDQLTSFTRARVGGGLLLDLAECDLARICWNVVEDLKLSTGLPIQLAAAGELRGVWDEDRVTQVLSNLITNALDHAAPGTLVRVNAKEKGEHVVVEVGNEGLCIPVELAQSIFSAFRRAESATSRGTKHLGLGLFISSEIALAHGGTLAVVSGEGRTTFTLELPRRRPTQVGEP